MSFVVAYYRIRTYVRVTLVAVGMLALLLFSMRYSLATTGSQFRFFGTIISVPDNPNGSGNWIIRQGNQGVATTYTVIADQNTQFDNGLPGVGQLVEVRGDLQAHNTVVSTTIRGINGNNNQDVEFKGIVVTAPSGQIGQWVFHNEQGVTQTVVADANTSFDNGVPVVGQWAEVKATIQPDSSLLATLIRPDGFETSEVVARLATGVLSTTVADRYNLIPESTLLASGNIFLFRTSDGVEQQLVRQMTADSEVIWAELNFVGRIPTGNPARVFHWGGADPTGYIDQSAFTQVDLAPAIAQYTGSGSVVAVLDTGVDLSHPSLLGHLVNGWDMVADDAIPQDEGDGSAWGHGTHIAGIIAHIAPASQIMPVRVLDTNGRGNTFTLAYAIDWATTHGANVINLSLGTDADSHVLREAITDAITRGAIVVAAAGNDNTNARRYPVSYHGVIGVTAVDGADVKADFANYNGNWVELAAPGVGITSTMIGPLGSGYASWSGTSMATSFVSGAAALAHQKFSQASPAAIGQVLQDTAHNIDALNPAYAGQIGGLLDIGAALAATVSETGTPTPEATPTFAPTTPPPSATATPVPGTEGTRKLYLPLVKKPTRR